MPEYKYGMRLRGFSPGCQPQKGFIERIDTTDKKWYDILIYNRRLTEKELRNYELDEIIDDSFPDQFRAFRKRLGMSQAAFAKHYGMSKRCIECWEEGSRLPADWVKNLLFKDMEQLLKEKTGAE